MLFSFKYLINSDSKKSGSSTCSLNVSLSKNNAAAYVPTFVLRPGTLLNSFLILNTSLCNIVYAFFCCVVASSTAGLVDLGFNTL